MIYDEVRRRIYNYDNSNPSMYVCTQTSYSPKEKKQAQLSNLELLIQVRTYPFKGSQPFIL